MKQRRPYEKGIATKRGAHLAIKRRNKEDLMKKGLRRGAFCFIARRVLKQRRPYEKGIATI